MSHEAMTPGRFSYTVPQSPSDVLRTRDFDEFFRKYYGAAFTVRTADGWSWSSAHLREPAFVATFSARGRLDAVISDATEATLARVFLDGDLDIQGDVSALLSVAAYTLRQSDSLSGNLLQTIGRISLDISRRLKPGKRQEALANWRRAPCSRELPDGFFTPWLGGTLAQSCAFFAGPDEEMDAAQQAGMKHALDALHIERGDRLLDAACGWGSLAMRAGARRNADVHGVTTSEAQAAIAGERITEAGLERRCFVECRNLRTQPYRPETFDKIADLAIFEPVPSGEFPDYLSAIQAMLVPGGLLLLDRLTRPPHRPTGRSAVLPAGVSADSLSRDLEAAESAGLDVVTVESLQPHYERTLRVWIQRLRRTAHAGDRAHRCWLLFLVETAAALDAADLQAHRILLRRPQEPAPQRRSMRGRH